MWRLIKKEPPEAERRVLTCISKGGHPYIPEVAFLMNGIWYGAGNKPLRWAPTHWMPEPDRPDEEPA